VNFTAGKPSVKLPASNRGYGTSVTVFAKNRGYGYSTVPVTALRIDRLIGLYRNDDRAADVVSRRPVGLHIGYT
jgi:hypothetical protein